MLWSLNKISQLIFQGNVWRSVWRTRMRILDLKGKVFFGLRQEMDSETLAKLSTQMFLCKPSRERLLQRNGPEWAKERPSNVLWFIVLGTQQLYFSRLKMYDFFFLLKTGCIEALGMESGEITDAQLSASSQYSGRVYKTPSQGRLNFQSDPGKIAGAWCPRKNDPDPWLQVDFRSYTTVTRIATQGRNGWGNWWVTKYRLLYSDNGITFHYHKDPSDNSAKVNYLFLRTVSHLALLK